MGHFTSTESITIWTIQVQISDSFHLSWISPWNDLMEQSPKSWHKKTEPEGAAPTRLTSTLL